MGRSLPRLDPHSEYKFLLMSPPKKHCPDRFPFDEIEITQAIWLYRSERHPEGFPEFRTLAGISMCQNSRVRRDKITALWKSHGKTPSWGLEWETNEQKVLEILQRVRALTLRLHAKHKHLLPSEDT